MAALVFVAGGFAPLAMAADADRDPYLAVRRDGTTFSGVALRDWDDHGKPDRLDGTTLHTGGNPVVAIQRVGARAEPRLPFIEFTNGDRLPAELVPAGDADADHTRLRVRPLAVPSGGNQPAGLLVETTAIRRIAFDQAGTEAAGEAGEVLLRDGRRSAARDIRFAPGVVRLLTDRGVETHGWSELSALCLAPRATASGLRAAQQPPGLPNAARLVRIETTDGGVLTGFSTEIDVRGADRDRPHETTLLVSPAWADQPIAVRLDRVVSWSFRSPDAVPLAVLPASTTARSTLTGYTWRWRRLTGFDGSPVGVGGAPADLAITMHSRTAVRFDVPDGAVSLTGRVGIADAVGPGGCGVASVYRDRRRGKPAWASGFLIGGQPAARFEVGGLDGAKAVELLTDFGHEGRPEGADPLDIRDELVWARPMFVVKPPDRGPDDVWRAAMPAAAGWAPVTDDADAVRYRRDRLVSGRYASVAVVPPGGAVALGCDVTEPQAAALTLRVELTGVAAPVRVTAEANDEPVDLTIDGRPQDGGGVIEKPGVSELVVGVPGEAGGSREVRLVFTSDKPARGAAEAGLYVHDTSTATTPAAGESDGGPP